MIDCDDCAISPTLLQTEREPARYFVVLRPTRARPADGGRESMLCQRHAFEADDEGRVERARRI